MKTFILLFIVLIGCSPEAKAPSSVEEHTPMGAQCMEKCIDIYNSCVPQVTYVSYCNRLLENCHDDCTKTWGF